MNVKYFGLFSLSHALRPVYDPNSILVQMYFGSPPQPIMCMAVTYDSDTYVTADPDSCAGYNTCQLFNLSKSQFTDLSANFSSFSRTLSTGNPMTGYYVQAQLAMKHGSNLWGCENAIFAVATQSDVPICVIGLGPRNGESTGVQIENGSVSPTYANVPILLRNAGLIDSASYSLFLAEGRGSLEFGVVDHSKFSGHLTLVPIVDYTVGSHNVEHTKAPLEARVVLTGLSIERKQKIYPVMDLFRPAIVAIGTQATYLPQQFLDAMVDFYGLIYVPELAAYIAPCNIPGSIIFEVSGYPFKVPLKHFLTPTSRVLTTGARACQILMPPTGDLEYCALGNSFAMANYLAVDLDTLQIGIAPLVTSANLSSVNYNAESISKAFEKAPIAPLFNETARDSSVFRVYPVPKAATRISLQTNSASHAQFQERKRLRLWSIIIFLFFI